MSNFAVALLVVNLVLMAWYFAKYNYKSHMIYVTYSVEVDEGKRRGIMHMTVPKSLDNDGMVEVIETQLGVKGVVVERVDVVGKTLYVK